jgi:hypothetical protein
MSYTTFELAFWHPFGPHGRETPKQIIERKRSEIAANGWTLWSFQHRRMLYDWHREISGAGPDAVFVFCSEGRGAVDPARDGVPATNCQSYRFVPEKGAEWRPTPKGIKIPHPFRPGKTLASAFVVQGIIHPAETFVGPAVEWFSLREGPWRQTRVPTRGEYLIRPGGTIAMRSFSAVLELGSPYLAVVASADPSTFKKKA